jgi:hypothetical protein
MLGSIIAIPEVRDTVLMHQDKKNSSNEIRALGGGGEGGGLRSRDNPGQKAGH